MSATERTLTCMLFESWVEWWCNKCQHRPICVNTLCENPHFEETDTGTIRCTRYRSEASAL